MLITVAVDDALYERAMSELPPGTAPAVLIEEALQALVLAKSARRLATTTAGAAAAPAPSDTSADQLS